MGTADIGGFHIQIDEGLANDIKKVGDAIKAIDGKSKDAGAALQDFVGKLNSIGNVSDNARQVAEAFSQIKQAMSGLSTKKMQQMADSVATMTTNVNSLKTDNLTNLFATAQNPAENIYTIISKLVQQLATIDPTVLSRSLENASKIQITQTDPNTKVKSEKNAKSSIDTKAGVTESAQTLHKALQDYFLQHPIRVKLDDQNVNIAGFERVKKALQELFANISVTLKATDVLEKGQRKTREKSAESVKNVPTVDDADKKALDEINEKLRNNIQLLREKKNILEAGRKATGSEDMFVKTEIESLKKTIDGLNKAKQELLVKRRGVAEDQSLIKSQQEQYKLNDAASREGRIREQNIAFLTQSIRLMDELLKKGRGVTMFDGAQQYLVDAQASLKKILAEQKMSTEERFKLIEKEVKAEEDKERKIAEAEAKAVQDRIKANQEYARSVQSERQKTVQMYAQMFAEIDAKDKAEKDARVKRLNELYQEQLKLTGKIGTLNNQRTVVQEKTGIPTATLSPKQEQLAQEYAHQLSRVNAEITRTVSLVGYVDAQNAKETTRIALLEQEIKLQKELDAALEKVYAAQQKQANASNTTLSASQIKSMENEYARLLTQIDKINSAKDKMNKTQSVAQKSGNTVLSAQMSASIQSADQELNRLNTRKVELENKTQLQLDKIRETHERKRGEQAVKDFETSEKEKTRKAEQEAKRRADIISRLDKRRLENYQGTPDFALNFGNKALRSGSLNDLINAQKRLKAAMSNLNPNDSKWKELNKTYQETKKRIDDIKKSMGDLGSQTNSLIPKLKNLAMQFGLVFSAQQIFQWVKHMTQVRAQFELQNIALRSIIRDKEKADEVFMQVQQLAMQSPFSIMQLNTYTKQIAAYGVEAEKLVGTTKQLADVSAGLGVDMGRLILAYGQVKTANYLRATEVRQFTEAGLNITQELANYYTELTGKMTRAADVTEMITKRMVKFEDVAEVFKRITSAGGMFFEMQQKQAEGLAGQMQRIGDAYSMMLNNIGTSNQSTLTFTLSSIREVIQNWRLIKIYIEDTVKALAAFYLYQKRALVVSALTKVAGVWKLIGTYIRESNAGLFMQTSALGRIVMIANGLKSLLSGLWLAFKAALSATGILLVATAIFKVINYFEEARAKADQLADSLGRINDEIAQDMSDSISTYERLARVISDGTRSYEERKEAMEEMQRTFEKILPKEYLENSYILDKVGSWTAAKDAMEDYYNSQALQKEKAAIDEAYKSEITEAINDISKQTLNVSKDNLDINLGLNQSDLKSIVNDIINQVKEGTITTAEEATNEYVRRIEEFRGKKLSEDAKSTIADVAKNYLLDKNFSNLIDSLNKVKEKYDDLDASQTHYRTKEEKAQAEETAQVIKHSEAVMKMVEQYNSALNQINVIGGRIAQVKLLPEGTDKTEKLKELNKSLLEAEKSATALGKSMNVKMPDYDGVATNVSKLEDAQKSASKSIVDFFKNGIDPEVVNLKLDYERLGELQRKIEKENKSAHKGYEDRVKSMNKQVELLVDSISARSKKLGVEVKGDIKEIAKEPKKVETAFINACNATQSKFKTLLTTYMPKWIQNIAKMIGKLFSDSTVTPKGKGVTVKTDPTITENKKLVNSIAVSNKYMHIHNDLFLKGGQSISEYTKNLKTAVEENEKLIKSYDKATDKKEWLKLRNVTKDYIKDKKNETKTMRAIALAYDPTIFDKKGKKSDGTEELARRRFEFLKRANSEYERLLQNYDKESSKRKILNDMMSEAKTLGIGKQFSKDLFDKASTMNTLQDVYDTFYKGLKAKYPKIAQEFEKTMSGLKTTIEIDARKKDLDNIKRQIDDLFGDYDLYRELQKSGVGNDLISSIFNIDPKSLEQVEGAIKQVFVKIASARNDTEYNDYISAVEATGEEGVKIWKDAQQKVTENYKKELREREKEYAKYLKHAYEEGVAAEVESFSKLQQLQSDEQFKKNEVNKRTDLTDDQKKQLISGIESQSRQIAEKFKEELEDKMSEVNFTNFKESPLFEQMFSDLSIVGTKTIDTLLGKIGELKKNMSSLKPKQIKELIEMEDKLFAAKAEQKPYASYIQALKDVNALKKEGLTLNKLNEEVVGIQARIDALRDEERVWDELLALQNKSLQNAKIGQLSSDLKNKLSLGNEDFDSLYSTAKSASKDNPNDEELQRQVELLTIIKALRDQIAKQKRDGVAIDDIVLGNLNLQGVAIQQNADKVKKKGKAEEENLQTTNNHIGKYKRLSDAEEKAISATQEWGDMAKRAVNVFRSGLEAINGELTEEEEAYATIADSIIECITQAIIFAVALKAVGTSAKQALGIIGYVLLALEAIVGIIGAIGKAHDARIQKKIEQEEKAIKRLQQSYEDLGEAIENAYSGYQLATGTTESIEALKAQNESYTKMIALEQDKKKTDNDKIEEWRDAQRENLKEIDKLQKQFIDTLGGLATGSAIKDAASEFVDAWQDAFNKTGSGLSGLEDNFADFIKNIVKQQTTMKVAERWINTFADKINSAFDEDSGAVDRNKLSDAMGWFTNTALPEMNGFLEDWTDMWEQFGVTQSSSESNLSGLAKGIQGVSEETAQIVEAMLNSMRFYMVDTNQQVASIAEAILNPPADNPFLAELRAQTRQLETLNRTMSSLMRAGHKMGGSGLKVFVQ